MIRDAAVAVALANLLFYPVWSELLPGSYGHYFLQAPPSLNMHLAVALSVFLTALCFWLGARVIRRSSLHLLYRVGKLAFLAVLLIALNTVRYHAIHFSPAAQARLLSTLDAFLLKPAALLCLLLLLTRWRPRVVWAALVLVLVFLPFAGVTLSQTAWAVIKFQTKMPFSDFQHQPPAAALPTPPDAPRVIFFLFDGLDQRLVFEARPADLELPHLDRFRSQSIYSVSAHPPAGNTLLSIPALLTGRPIASARPSGANDLLIQFDDTGTLETWSSQSDLFTKTRALGRNTALIGYYHPYCRVIGSHVTKCFWRTDRWGSLGMDDPDASILEMASRVLATETNRICASLPWVWRFGFFRSSLDLAENKRATRLADHVQNYLDILKETKTAIADPTIHLLYVHWPVPHHPYIYDRKTNDFSWHSESSYVDNLVLVDKTLAETLEVLKISGLEKTTAVLITSDHWLNRADPNPDSRRVPFLLKLPGQIKTVTYGHSWNTAGIPDLLLNVLSGKVSEPTDVLSHLDRIRLQQETPKRR